MTGPREPSAHRLAETSEDVEAFWREQKPTMDAHDAAVDALVQVLVGLPVDRARQVVADEARRRGVNLTFRIISPDEPIAAIYQFGRVTAIVRDGVVEAAERG